jgi:hypothetical protein
MIAWVKRLFAAPAPDPRDDELKRLAQEAIEKNLEVIARLDALDDPLALVHGARNYAHTQQTPGSPPGTSSRGPGANGGPPPRRSGSGRTGGMR